MGTVIFLNFYTWHAYHVFVTKKKGGGGFLSVTPPTSSMQFEQRVYTFTTVIVSQIIKTCWKMADLAIINQI